MKTVIILVFFLLFSQNVKAQTVSLGTEYDLDDKLAHNYFVDQIELKKMGVWELGENKDFLSAKNLINIAKTRVALPLPKEAYEIGQVVGVDWRRGLSVWLVKVSFLCFKKNDPANKVPVRNDGVIVSVHLLPTGAVITDTVRPMTADEIDQMNGRK